MTFEKGFFILIMYDIEKVNIKYHAFIGKTILFFLVVETLFFNCKLFTFKSWLIFSQSRIVNNFLLRGANYVKSCKKEEEKSFCSRIQRTFLS